MSAILEDVSVTFNFMQNKFQIGLGLLQLFPAQCGCWCEASPDLVRAILCQLSSAPMTSVTSVTSGLGGGKLQSVLCRRPRHNVTRTAVSLAHITVVDL